MVRYYKCKLVLKWYRGVCEHAKKQSGAHLPDLCLPDSDMPDDFMPGSFARQIPGSVKMDVAEKQIYIYIQLQTMR